MYPQDPWEIQTGFEEAAPLRHFQKIGSKKYFIPCWLLFFVDHCLIERVHLYVCMFLTTLLLVDTINTIFSLIDFNEALEMILLV